MPVTYSNTSPYRRTPQRNFLVEYLDIAQLPNIPADLSDELITISPQYHERPDLLSYKLYGRASLWWVFAMRNLDDIIDPIYDFQSGLEIFVPTKQRLFSLLGL